MGPGNEDRGFVFKLFRRCLIKSVSCDKYGVVRPVVKSSISTSQIESAGCDSVNRLQEYAAVGQLSLFSFALAVKNGVDRNWAVLFFLGVFPLCSEIILSDRDEGHLLLLGRFLRKLFHLFSERLL